MTSIIRNSMKFMMQEQSWVLYSRTERRQAQTANGMLRESYFGASDFDCSSFIKICKCRPMKSCRQIYGDTIAGKR